MSASSDTVRSPGSASTRLPSPDGSSGDQKDSPYAPWVYSCTGYGDEEYQYFDGSPGPDKDQRFTIDLENGSMDRLRDVRPYLYYVGYWWSRTTSQPNIEKGLLLDVEDEYVRGREFLMQERAIGHGYFLGRREWGEYNKAESVMFPFARVAHSEEKGDVGCDLGHGLEQYDQDCCAAVLLTNVRTPLPSQTIVKTKPEDPDWDRFIQWLYSPSCHGIMFMVNCGWGAHQVEFERTVQGMPKWLLPEKDDF